MKKILCLCFFLSSFFVQAQTIVTFTLDSAGEDATINSWFNNNYPNELEYVCADVIGFQMFQGAYRNFLKFDLTSVPANSNIISAKLSLYYPDSTNFVDGDYSMGNSNESVLQRVTSAWAENTVTWSNQPPSTTTDQVILPESISQYQDYPNIDVTAMVQQMVSNPSMNFGFLLRLTTESYWCQLLFASGDYPDSSIYPKLEITYMPVGIEENSFSNAINIFPNPTTTEVTINFNEATRHNIQLTNTLGELLEQTQINSSSHALDMSNKPKGIYFITVTDEQGNKVVRKVVKM